jgi:hypothetical protein
MTLLPPEVLCQIQLEISAQDISVHKCRDMERRSGP